MRKLTRSEIKNLIVNELSAIGEDVLVQKSAEKTGTPPMGSSQLPKFKKKRGCSVHGTMYETDCNECGMAMYEDEQSQLNEGSCCDTGSCGCEPKHNSYPYEKDIDNLDYHSVLKQLMGMHSGGAAHKHHGGAYMSKSQLYKISKYSEKLYALIPDGHNLEDWMRTKISQIADDIGEVYHALDHDNFEGDL